MACRCSLQKCSFQPQQWLQWVLCCRIFCERFLIPNHGYWLYNTVSSNFCPNFASEDEAICLTVITYWHHSLKSQSCRGPLKKNKEIRISEFWKALYSNIYQRIHYNLKQNKNNDDENNPKTAKISRTSRNTFKMKLKNQSNKENRSIQRNKQT